MATKWAVVNGQWSAGATWNDGVVPVDGDYVYLDGHIITISAPNLPNTIVSNDVNPNTELSGGHMTYNPGYGHVNVTFKKLIARNTPIYTCQINNTYGETRLTFDIDNKDGYAINFIGSDNDPNLYYVGNVETNHDVFDSSGKRFRNVRITGNLTTTQPCYFMSQANRVMDSVIHTGNNDNITYSTGEVTNCTINGNVKIGLNQYAKTLVLNGNLTAVNSSFYGLDGTIGGNIEYSSTNGATGFEFANKTFLNINFTWKDVTEPRSNPFIILTDAEMNNRQQYPSEADVRKDVEYAWGVLKGQLEQVQVGCVTKEDVREGVALLGMSDNGTLVVPSADDVREGVVFDNGSVGTLIVQGGGDRLRIANFGYYTDSQSNTYIVDINESFKPMFATAEESVLLELFPELDLDDIPDKYFDDLFVKYLKYRLIVEYYRGAGINSVFTPSELTTEVVNYQNVRCEYWLNLANIYLNAWDKKYPNSIKKQRILL